MPSLEENRRLWGADYGWDGGGEEWSSAWGGSAAQWRGTILPRIAEFLPAGTILEIAPGFGRWTRFLKDACRKLILVDLSDKCIDACRERFASAPNIEYFVNDGMSLGMVPDGEVDFAFSFDSLVHADARVMEAYVSQLAAKLSPQGGAFLHHSNLGQYPLYGWLAAAPRLKARLESAGLVERRTGWRDPGMSAARLRGFARRAGLSCVRQERIAWDTKRLLVDCLSTVVRKGSARDRAPERIANRSFMEEAARLKGLPEDEGGDGRGEGAPR